MGRLNSIVGKVYLDANIFIYVVEGPVQVTTMPGPLFERIEHGEVQAITSELTLAEVLVKPLREAKGQFYQEYLNLLSGQAAITMATVTRGVLLEAANLRSMHRLRLPDAIHVATALLSGCGTLLSNDLRMKAIRGINQVNLMDLAG